MPLGVLIVGQEPKLLEDLAQSHDDLTKSITAFAPGASRPAMQYAISALLRPRGSRVSGVIQMRSESVGGVGLSIAINDLSPGQDAERLTIWESPGTDGARLSMHARLHALARPASVMVSCELLRRRLVQSAPSTSWLERGRMGERQPNSERSVTCTSPGQPARRRSVPDDGAPHGAGDVEFLRAVQSISRAEHTSPYPAVLALSRGSRRQPGRAGP